MKLHPQPSDNKQDVGRSTLHFDYHVITVMVLNLFWISASLVLTDYSVSLDQILIQLKEVAPKWRELAVAVGAENVDEISDFVRKALKHLALF